jgi:hypothetical protein
VWREIYSEGEVSNDEAALCHCQAHFYGNLGAVRSIDEIRIQGKMTTGIHFLLKIGEMRILPANHSAH